MRTALGFSRRTWLGFSGLLLALLAVFAGEAGATSGATPDLPAPYLQANLVNCGDTITSPGEYLLAAGCTWGASEKGAAIHIHANDVHLNLGGHTIAGGPTDSPGIELSGITSGVTGVHVNNGTVTGFSTGVLILAGGENHINGVTATGNFFGIKLRSSSGNHINGNTATGNFHFGVALIGSSGNHFNTNVITGNGRRGECPGPGGPGPGGGGNLLLKGSDQNTINSNDLSGGFCVGVELFDSHHNVVRSNTANGTLSGGGIGLDGSNGNVVRGNTTDGNLAGIVLANSDGNTVSGNSATGNTFGGGIQLFVGSENNLVQGNTATGNTAGPASGPFTPMDLIDLNPECDDNTWKGNTFGTAIQPCIQ